MLWTILIECFFKEMAKMHFTPTKFGVVSKSIPRLSKLVTSSNIATMSMSPSIMVCYVFAGNLSKNDYVFLSARF